MLRDISETAYTRPNFSRLISNHFMTYYILGKGTGSAAVQLRNTVAFLSSTPMSCLNIPHRRPHVETTPAAVSNLTFYAIASVQIFTGIDVAFMLLKLRSVPIHRVLMVRPNLQLSDGTSATCKPIDEEPPALVILKEKGLGDQGEQLHMNIEIQGNLPPVFFKEHQLRHGRSLPVEEL